MPPNLKCLPLDQTSENIDAWAILRLHASPTKFCSTDVATTEVTVCIRATTLAMPFSCLLAT